MKPRNGRPWNRAEKFLVLSPALVLAIVFGWRWFQSQWLPRTIDCGTWEARTVQISPDNQKVAITMCDQSWPPRYRIGIFDMASQRNLYVLPIAGWVGNLNFSEDSTSLVFPNALGTGRACQINRVDVQTGQLVWQTTTTNWVESLTFAQKESRLVSRADTTGVWDARTGKLLHMLSPQNRFAQSVLSKDDRTVAYGRSKPATRRVVAVATPAFNALLAPEMRIALYDVATNTEKQNRLLRREVIAFATDQRTFAAIDGPNSFSSSQSRRLEIYDWKSSRPRVTHPLPGHAVWWLRFGGNGRFIVAASLNSARKPNADLYTVAMFDVPSGRELWRRTGINVSNWLFFNRDASILVSTGLKQSGKKLLGQVTLSETATGKPLRTFATQSGSSYVSLSRDEKTLAITDGHFVRLWSIEDIAGRKTTNAPAPSRQVD